MIYTATSPTGEQMTVEITDQGTRICRHESPEICYVPDDPKGEGIKIALETLWHRGWKIDVERS